MRKSSLAALAAISAVSLVACGRPLWNEAPPPGDVLFLRTGKGISLVSTISEAATLRLSNAVPSTDWSAVVQAVSRGGTTWVEAFDSSSGDKLWSREAPGNLRVKVSSKDGRFVALGTPGRGATGYPSGRSTTRLVVIDQDSAEPRTIRLEGNYEPEAFSLDGGSLFVIQYLPPRRPASYRVRRLDLRTEKVMGVYTVDAELQRRMQGTARIQAASPDGRRLYTLYTIDGPRAREAFVHVLSLDELWAHCVDLPASFASGSESDIALSVTPDGSRLFVAHGGIGAVAEIDTELQSVVRTANAPIASEPGDDTHAATGRDDKLYVGRGSTVLALDAFTLRPAGSWDLWRTVTGLQAAGRGGRLYVGLYDQIAILETTAGRTLEVLDPASIGRIGQLGQTTRSLVEERKEVVCAC